MVAESGSHAGSATTTPSALALSTVWIARASIALTGAHAATLAAVEVIFCEIDAGPVAGDFPGLTQRCAAAGVAERREWSKVRAGGAARAAVGHVALDVDAGRAAAHEAGPAHVVAAAVDAGGLRVRRCFATQVAATAVVGVRCHVHARLAAAHRRCRAAGRHPVFGLGIEGGVARDHRRRLGSDPQRCASVLLELRRGTHGIRCAVACDLRPNAATVGTAHEASQTLAASRAGLPVETRVQ